jgi:hypothetical protein
MFEILYCHYLDVKWICACKLHGRKGKLITCKLSRITHVHGRTDEQRMLCKFVFCTLGPLIPLFDALPTPTVKIAYVIVDGGDAGRHA